MMHQASESFLTTILRTQRADFPEDLIVSGGLTGNEH